MFKSLATPSLVLVLTVGLLGRQNYPPQVIDQALYEADFELAPRTINCRDVQEEAPYFHRMPVRFSCRDD